MVYVYDGSYAGFLCCIFASFEYNESVDRLDGGSSDRNEQLDFFNTSRTISTDATKAKRVAIGLDQRVGRRVAHDFFRAFLSENAEARWIVFAMMQKAFRGIPLALENHGDSDIHFYHLTLKKITRERHRMKAFIRFSKSNDELYFATIEPDFNVLPLIVDFFKKRYADQKWLIYDIKRNYGMLYDLQNVIEIELTKPEKEGLTADQTIELDERDEHFQNLWKLYFKSTNIVERKNLKLHLKHVPRRYWKYLVEKQ